MRYFFAALLTGSALAACAGTGTVGYQASVYTTTPELVYVSPGVQVIADYHEPVFYTNDSYWRYYNGTWYRSRYYNRGWTYASPPRALLRIERPRAYIRYRPRGHGSHVRRDRPVIRDHRDHRDDSRRYRRR